MEKKVLFALICACVLGFVTSSCSSDSVVSEVEIDDFVDDDGFCIYTNIIGDVADETGVVYRDYFIGGAYIDAANGNRYYLIGEDVRSIEDNMDTVERLASTGMLEDGNHVKFSGKVYDVDERLIPTYQKRLDTYGWPEGAIQKQKQLWLPVEGHTFCLVAPDFTIEKIE